MVKVLNRRLVAAGDVIFREGEEGSQAYIVQTGLVRIEKTRSTSDPMVLGRVRPGGIFGEMALIDKSPRMASAIADANTTLISIPEETLRKKLRNADPVVRMMIQVMIRMIRAVAEQGDIGEKVVDELLKVAVEDDANPGSPETVFDPRRKSMPLDSKLADSNSPSRSDDKSEENEDDEMWTI